MQKQLIRKVAKQFQRPTVERLFKNKIRCLIEKDNVSFVYPVFSFS